MGILSVFMLASIIFFNHSFAFATEPKEINGKHRYFGYTFLVTSKDGQPSISVVEAPNSIMDNRGVLQVGQCPASTVTKNLMKGITNPSIKPGILYAAVNPSRDAISEGVDLAYVTQGSVKWHGYNFSTTGGKGQLVFLSTLNWKKGPSPWRLNFGAGTQIGGMDLIKQAGYLTKQISGQLDLSPSGKSHKLKEAQAHLILHTAAGQAGTPSSPAAQANSPAYALRLLPDTVYIGMEENVVALGPEHNYQVEGFVDKKAKPVFAPPGPYAAVLLVTKIEKLK